jgi:hypothetical protein
MGSEKSGMADQFLDGSRKVNLVARHDPRHTIWPLNCRMNAAASFGWMRA